MKKTILLSAGAMTAFAGSAFAANIAGTGTVISGVHTAVTTTLGTAYARGDQAAHQTENDGLYGVDGDATTQRDTWGATDNAGLGALDGGFDYIGITGFTIGAGEQITNVTINMAGFGDGGYFTAAPTVQVTSDGGTTWSNVAATDNYAAALAGSTPGTPAPDFFTASFDFAGQTGVDGIRLIGDSAGPADTNGFIGVGEFEVNTTPVPEPTSSALLGLAGLALILRRRK